MDVLTLNGKRYVKASRAAKDLGYASDYVGQLCRNGSVDAHLVGRTWYVNPDTLGAHRVEKKRVSRTKAREYAKKAINESRSLEIANTEKSYKNIAIHYNTDGAGLIPEVKKIGILSDVARMPVQKESDDEPTYTILNPEKKVLMSGTIPVLDAEEEVQYTDVTILTPKIVKQRPSQRKVKLPVTDDVSFDNEETSSIEPEKSQDSAPAVPPSFTDRLREVEQRENVEVANTPQEPIAEEGARRSWVFIIVEVTSVVVILLSAVSLFIEQSATYSYPDNGESRMGISVDKMKEIIEKY